MLLCYRLVYVWLATLIAAMLLCYRPVYVWLATPIAAMLVCYRPVPTPYIASGGIYTVSRIAVPASHEKVWLGSVCHTYHIRTVPIGKIQSG